MVRGLGVSHKSLFVPSVTEGSYAIRFEHADYLAKDFNISVGSGLPTTFTEAMTERAYDMAIVLPNANGKLFLSNTIIVSNDPITACTDFNFQVKNNGNITESATYNVTIVGGGDLYSGTISNIAPGATSATINEDVCALPGGLPLGTHTIKVEVRPQGQEVTDTVTDLIYAIEWTTDITFVATAPGIPDLHGVEVFIDNVSMGTT